MMKISHLLLTAVLLFACSVDAQQPSLEGPGANGVSMAGVELKGKAPVNPDVLQVTLPKPQEATLENGLRIALLEDHKLPTFFMQLVIEGGGLADPIDKRGLAMATAAVLREGAKERSSRQIAEQLAALGATLTAGASLSSGETSVSVSGLIENIDATLALAADVVRTPNFPETELAKFKSRFLSRLQYQRSLPAFVAQEQFMRAVYGEHPGGSIAPASATLAALTSADLRDYHATYYRPNRTLLVAYGDITLKALSAKFTLAFGEWPRGQAPSRRLPELSPPDGAHVLLVDRPGSVQTSLWLGGLGIERNSDDYFAVLVMNHILGGGPASRLFLNLREDKGYTYGVYSSFTGSSFPGVVVASMDVRTSVTEGALQELFAEIRRIGAEPAPALELANAKRALIGRFALSLDAPQALIANLATQKIYGLPADYWETYPARVAAIASADVARVARKYYADKRLQMIAVGDGAAVRQTLEKYGKVEAAGGGE